MDRGKMKRAIMDRSLIAHAPSWHAISLLNCFNGMLHGIKFCNVEIKIKMRL